MNDYKQIKHRLTKEEQEGMARIVEAIRLKRIEATKPTPEDVKNVEGVRAGAHPAVLLLLYETRYSNHSLFTASHKKRW